MNKKIDLTVLLKDCPSGMELDCLMYEDVYFDYVDERNIIHCYIQHETHKTSITFNQHGTHNSDIKSKCIIFPKGKTTWEGFQRPFVDGDIVTDIEGAIIIYQEITTSGYCGSFASLDHRNQFIPHYKAYLDYIRLSTDEEKEKLFQAIKDNGYKWNPETKTLEKLKKEKFDPKILKPFDKVLVRCSELEVWHISFFEKYKRESTKYPFVCINCSKYAQCIPYNEDTKHLVGKSENASEFYKY